MDTKELEQVSNEAQVALDLKIPWWGKVLLFLVKFLPLPPWLKAILPIIIGIIEALPLAERRQAKAELMAAARADSKSKRADKLIPVVKKYCTPGLPGCGSDLVR